MEAEGSNDRALLVAMPLQHLESARADCEERGSAILPAGGPGDLDDAPRGIAVLLISTDAGEEQVPAVTWRAVFAGRVAHRSGEPWPEGVVETWTAAHDLRPARPAPVEPDTARDDVDDEDEDEPDEVGPQSFFEVRELAVLPRTEWVFANELVPKQQRGGRTFVPRTPRLIGFVD
jgi:hypothetical protein